MSVEQRAVDTIKTLGIDAIQKANSGHPGMVMGMSDIACVLWHDFLKYNPQNPNWPDRDRVVLSNGHGSMLLYSMLHMTGTSLSMDDLKNFRQWGSPTAGHPEYGFAAGIETTTGPLGQGVANGVGLAMAERWLAQQCGADIVDHFTYVLCGDGCLMEGIASEAASLAGHLNLSKLIMLYDDNKITIDGETDIAFSEDVCARFLSYGWDVQKIDGHDRVAIREAISKAQKSAAPSLIACRTFIGKGSPNKEGSNKTHGSPLGAEEIRATKSALGFDPDQSFHVSQAVYDYFREKDEQRAVQEQDWNERLRQSKGRDLFAQLYTAVDVSKVEWPVFESGTQMATRNANGSVIQAIAKALPQVVGGSADLAGSNKTTIKGSAHWSGKDFSGRNIHFGVREHAMASICNGLSLHGGVQPFCATFLVFHDYMRPAVRLASIMHQPVIFIYTHDSIYVGEDGPTHQPIEQLESMRLIPNLWVFRPADANESALVWKAALMRRDGPSALCFTRQKLPVLARESVSGAERGGYVLSDSEGDKVVSLIATGSEVALALDAAELLQSKGWGVRVISIPCRELFEQQGLSYRTEVLGNHPRFVIEAGVGRGWYGYFSSMAHVIALDRFGASAPGDVVARELGLSASNICNQVEALVHTAQ